MCSCSDPVFFEIVKPFRFGCMYMCTWLYIIIMLSPKMYLFFYVNQKILLTLRACLCTTNEMFTMVIFFMVVTISLQLLFPNIRTYLGRLKTFLVMYWIWVGGEFEITISIMLAVALACTLCLLCSNFRIVLHCCLFRNVMTEEIHVWYYGSENFINHLKWQFRHAKWLSAYVKGTRDTRKSYG